MSDLKKKVEQPKWEAPTLVSPPPTLHVQNSLTRTKVPFVPMEGRRVLWYSCGPTVYDSAHMGHARTYLSFDIIRRILEDYFNYDVVMVMNITDIDDKIIMRSNERGITAEELARQYEAEFLQDMDALGCLKPDVLTRVSEYVPEIIEMTVKIISNGMGYESNGSVYFDVTTFDSHEKHAYGKLVPENVGDAAANAEGEGALGGDFKSEKKNPCDFALWKKSKEGEPWWDSPWGKGRPGWHIECSAMAGSVFKMMGSGNMDIHTGGIDLRFPHHDNEMAQAEAYFGCNQWVNYFLHSGHLHIDGLKMSKSLKNFIKIKQALEFNDKRQIRMLYLLCKWNTEMNYSDGALETAATKITFFNNFFQKVKAVVREKGNKCPQRWNEEEFQLHNFFLKLRDAVHAAMCDDFNTPEVMSLLETLARKFNVYMEKEATVVPLLLRRAAAYITNLFTIFGLIEKSSEIGFPITSGGGDLETTVTPYLDVIRDFRQAVRGFARSGDNKQVLIAADKVRDDILPELGVLLEDKGDESVWKFENKEELLKQRELKKAAEEEKIKKKAEAQIREAEKLAQKQAAGQVPAGQMFRLMTDKYSEWDEKGMPTKDLEGKEVSKSNLKKLQKEQEKQIKINQELGVDPLI